MSGLYIVWKSECFRSAQTAYVLNYSIEYVYPPSSLIWSRNVAFRYLYCSVKTIGLLAFRRPSELSLLNQPFLLAAIAVFYGLVARVPVILDCHSKVYDPEYPALLRRFYRWASRNVVVNINHNVDDSRIVQSYGGESVIISSIPFRLPVSHVTEATSKGYVFCVCSFAADEPLNVIIDAARGVDAAFYITGNYRKRADELVHVPDNVRLLGFVEATEYYGLMQSAGVVLTLSNRSRIMQMAVEEALVLGVPVVTNFSPVLQSVLPNGGTFVELDGSAVAEGIKTALSNQETLRAGVVADKEAQMARVWAALQNVKRHLEG